MCSQDRLWPPLPDGGYTRLSKDVNSVGELAESFHDAELWRSAFKAAGDGTNDPDMPFIRALRVLIWLQTKKAIRLAMSSAPCIPFALVKPAAETQCVICKTDTLPAALPGDSAPEVQVREQDMLVAAGEFTSEGHSVAVLNMANPYMPGGGYESGAGAQEENLHRRSDAVRFTVRQRKNYPILEEACLLSTGVTVFRGSEKDGYPFLEHPFQIALLSCAAVAHPLLTPSGEYRARAVHEAMEAKVAAILAAALQAKCEVLILSAFGCGAFGNPPKVVAELFHRALQRMPFRKAVFCIIDDHNAGHEHNPRGNVRPFQEEFGLTGARD
eukprot:CAMPEP_0171106478 /NCGR_PEP_ID=MMETSP0766_2-20121228/64818_1 /TAXON_ID=439317 /ORGANISM="Gambierdiscus australes, Strain CAWD 149" /LENGTH=327 /DNA_ID=CAMNT_0011567567 /DNA_START=55 /DNA_END=1038 /DNA_ORIENTATION=+